jgi:Uma2 family endonuclease
MGGENAVLGKRRMPPAKVYFEAAAATSAKFGRVPVLAAIVDYRGRRTYADHMVSTPPTSTNAPESAPEPAWEIARLFPPQGRWSEGSYLSFTESVSQIVELVDGAIQVPSMPTKTHQRIVHALLSLLLAFLRENRAGDAVAAPYRVWLRNGTFREPDIVVYTAEHLEHFGERYGQGADVVVEVVSDDAASRTCDYEDKRRDYAEAGIPEYWIVDPTESRILVLSLAGNAYHVIHDSRPGDEAASRVLSGFRVDVRALVAPDDRPPN